VTDSLTASVDAITIRRLALGDLAPVMAIERRSFSAPWSLAMFGLEISKPSTIALAATSGERLVGYLVCSRYDAVWHLMNVGVDLDWRRRGVATALVRELFARADRPGARYTLEVRPSNSGAVRMYERLGFRSAGRRPGYYHDNREDALIMWRTARGTGRPIEDGGPRGSGRHGRDGRPAAEVRAR
jgi:[ribosomal protein S18]-alanine N-acetyltransferase